MVKVDRKYSVQGYKRIIGIWGKCKVISIRDLEQ